VVSLRVASAGDSAAITSELAVRAVYSLRNGTLFCCCLTVGCRLCWLMLFSQASAAAFSCVRRTSHMRLSTFHRFTLTGLICFPRVSTSDIVHNFTWGKFLASPWRYSAGDN